MHAIVKRKILIVISTDRKIFLDSNTMVVEIRTVSLLISDLKIHSSDWPPF